MVAPLALGGAVDWAAGLCAILATSAASAALVAFAPIEVRPPPVLWPFLLGVTWTLLQALPLPCSLVERLAPAAAADTARAAALLHTDLACHLSRDPGASWVELLKGIALLGVAVTTWRLAAAGRGTYVFRILAGAATLLAAVALVHFAASADQVFGVYAPLQAPSARFGPLLNPNTLAGAMVLGLGAAIALLLFDTTRLRPLWVAACCATTAAALVSLSRAGLAALAVVAVSGVLIAFRRRVQLASSPRVLAFGVVVTLGAVLAIVMLSGVTSSDTQAELDPTDTRKLELLRRGAEFTLLAPWVGVGRGGFSAAFAERYGSFRRAEYAENFVVQWLADWGAVVGIAVLACFAWLAIGALRRVHTDRRLVLITVLALAAQNLFDLGFELPGVALPAAAALVAAIVTKTDRSSGARTRAWWAPAVGITLVIVPLALSARDTDRIVMQRELEAAFTSGDEQAFEATLRHAVAIHPAEPAFPLLAGAMAARTDQGDALAWLNRAMVLAPGWASPHVVAAHWMLRRGHVDQCMLELREAAEIDASSTFETLCLVAGTGRGLEVASRAAPEGMHGWQVLDHYAGCMNESPARAAIDSRLIDLHASLSGPYRREVARLGADGHLDEARAVARGAPEGAGSDPSVALAEVLSAAELHSEAVTLLQAASDDAPRDRALLLALAHAQTRAGDADGMRATMARVRELAAGAPAAVIASDLELGGMEDQLGNQARALEAYRRTVVVEENPVGLYRQASILERMGQPHAAHDLYRRASELAPDDASYRAARDRTAARE
ncbi:MAG: O-antigen ligase family protein [Sandaracinus sp.]